MPLPSRPKSSKLETEKAQVNKILPTEEGPSEKSGEQHLHLQHHTTSSPSSHDTVKKRSAYEDLTTGCQSQIVQSKKKDNTELMGHVSRRKIKSQFGLVTSLSNKKKCFIPDMPTKFQTLTTKEPSVFQKTFVLNEESATEETSFVKQSCACHQETFLVEQPLTLLEETEYDNAFRTGPKPSKRKNKPREADIIEEVIDFAKPVTEKETLTAKAALNSSPLSLKNKYTIQEEKCPIQGKSSLRKKPLTSKVVNKEKSVIRKPHFKKKNPTTEMKSLVQEPSLLQEEYNSQGETSILKKLWVLLENTNNEGDTLTEPVLENTNNERGTLTEPVTFKRKHSTNEVVHTKKRSSFKNKRDTQGKGTNFKSLGVQPVSYEDEPLSFKKSTTKKDSHFQGPSVLPDKHSAQVVVSNVEKSLALQKPNNKEEVLNLCGAPPLKKPRCTKKSPHMKKHSPRKKRRHTKKKHFLKNPAVQEPDPSKPLPFKKSTKEKDSPSQGPSALPKRRPSPGVLSKLKNFCDEQRRHHIEESHFQSASASKKQHIMKEPASIQNPLTLEMQQTFTQGTAFHLNNSLGLQAAITGAESLTEEPVLFKKENTALPLQKCAPPIIPLWPAQSEWLENIDETRNLYSEKPDSLRNETITRFEQNSPSLDEYYSPSLAPTLLLFSEEKTSSQERAHSKESVTSNDDKIFFSSELFSPYSSADEDTFKPQMSLDLQEKTDIKNDKTLFDSQDSVSEEEAFLRKLFCKDRYPSSEESSQERSVALEQEFVLKKLLDENSSSEVDEPLSHHELLFENSSSPKKEASDEYVTVYEELSMEKMAALMDPCITQDNSIKETFLEKYTDTDADSKKCLTLQETTSIKEEATLEKPLDPQENPRAEMVTVLKELLVIVKKPNVEKAILTAEEKPPSGVEVLLNEVLDLVDKPTIGKESTLEEPLALQKNSNTKMEANLKKPLAIKDDASIDKASPNISLTFDHKADNEKDMGSRKTITVEEPMETLALNEGLTAADQLSFTDLPALEESTIIDKEAFVKSFLVFQHENNPNVSNNALESETGNFSAAMPGVEKINPVMNSNPYELDLKDLQSDPGEKQTEIIILDDSDTVERLEEEDQDPVRNSVYVNEIFTYLREREEKFIVTKYMDRQMELTSNMRALLVDWLVEVQTSLQMSHETLYLSVKLLDCYLMKAQCKMNHLQLLGSTAYMIAAKFEESYPPSLPEFLYICEDLYEKRDMVSLEKDILKTLDFDINIPTAYNFLRRYASCTHASMKTLTLSRYICEITLQEYEYVQEKPSKLAAASFLLAIYMRNLNNCIPLLEYYSGYKIAELHPLVRKLNDTLLFQPHNFLKNVYEKYSEEAYFEVSKIPPLDKNFLDEMLNYVFLS